MARKLLLSTVCLLLVLHLTLFGATEAAEILFELPLQACANVIHVERVGDVRCTLNGTRAIFQVPQRPGGVIDEGSGLYFQWTDVREQGRSGIRCAASSNENIFVMNLRDCQCALSRMNETVDGVNKVGINVSISHCPAPQQNLVASVGFYYTNTTLIEQYYPTLPFSTEDSFNYTSMYVARPKLAELIMHFDSPPSGRGGVDSLGPHLPPSSLLHFFFCCCLVRL